MSSAVLLEDDLLLDRDVVAEDHHVFAIGESLHRFDEGVFARHREQCDGGVVGSSRRSDCLGGRCVKTAGWCGLVGEHIVEHSMCIGNRFFVFGANRK